MYGAAPAGSVSVLVAVDLYPDSAATINVAGKGWREVLVLDDRAATSTMGAGNNRLSGYWDRTWACRSVLPGLCTAGVAAAADFPGGALGSSGGAHVKLAVHADLECSRLPEEHTLLLEGPLLKEEIRPRQTVAFWARTPTPRSPRVAHRLSSRSSVHTPFHSLTRRRARAAGLMD